MPVVHPAFPEAAELEIDRLGECRHPSPLQARQEQFANDDSRVLLCAETSELAPYLDSRRMPPAFEPAGPRDRIYFDPAGLTCGILTCGGLCPGLNNVIRSIVLRLTYAYGVRRILGFRYGYAGLASGSGHEPMVLTPEAVESLHEHGGTVLGSSRGPQDLGDMVDTLVKRRVGILFVIGGNGGLRGGSALSREIRARGLEIGVIGIPKTIDNDLLWIARSFGFDTAVEAASSTILAAHEEARAAWNGIGLVKLMGRHSGFIAAGATLATSDVNFCLVPEVPFTLAGDGGFLQALQCRLVEKHHAVIVVAEGAGQELVEDGKPPERDASGNVRLRDIGLFLKDRIKKHFAGQGEEVTIRYIDPSYAIRSLPANSFDAQFCLVLGQHAVHAGMAGRTNMMVGLWNQHFTHVPIPLAVSEVKQLHPRGEAWQRVLEATGQPASLVGH
jgi:6-phosphofructokinase 1